MKPMTDILTSWITEGHFRLTGFNPETKESRVFVDKKNLIMNPSAEIVARGLAGLPNAAISHLYLSYNNNGSYPGNGYTISNPSVTDFVKNGDTNHLRIPLTFPAIVTAPSAGSQLLTFNILVNQPTAFAIPTYATLGAGSKFFEAALVAQTSSSGSIADLSSDRVFSRVAFADLAYDSAFNLTITWAIKLTV